MTRARATLLACLALLATAPAAEAKGTRWRVVCAAHVPLAETPGGAVVAVVHRGDAVYLLARGPNGTWSRVRTDFGSRGWLQSRHVCRRR